MNDFQARRDINVSGDININNSTQEYKPFALLPTPRLHEEKTHRQNLLNEEEAKRTRYVPRLFIIAAVLGLFTAICQSYFSDLVNPIALGFTALGTIGSLYFAAQAMDNKSEFQLRQLEALKEIEMILRERRA